MKKTLTYLMACMALMQTSCHRYTPSNEIHLSRKVQEVEVLNLSEAVDTIEVICLESTAESFYYQTDKIEVTARDIWVKNGVKSILRFARDGKYMNTVGKATDYDKLEDFFVDDERREIYVFAQDGGILQYDFEGKLVQKVTSQRSDALFSAESQQLIFFQGERLLSQNLGLQRALEHPEDSLWSLARIDADFQKTKLFKNPAHEGREAEISEHHATPDAERATSYLWENPTRIDYYGGQMTVKFPDTDTIYSYNTTSQELEPQYIIVNNEEKPDYAVTHQWLRQREAFEYFELTDYYPTRDNIYLVGDKHGSILTYCYSKRNTSVLLLTKQGKVMEKQIVKRPYPMRRSIDTPLILTNDILGGDFRVRYRSSGKYWIDMLVPGINMSGTDVDKVKSSPINSPQRNEFLQLLESAGTEDNPILLIAVLK